MSISILPSNKYIIILNQNNISNCDSKKNKSNDCEHNSNINNKNNSCTKMINI